jgi:Ni,Fe-hydrogenase III component G
LNDLRASENVLLKKAREVAIAPAVVTPAERPRLSRIAPEIPTSMRLTREIGIMTIAEGVPSLS